METTTHTKELSAAATGMESNVGILGAPVKGVRKQLEVIAINIRLRKKDVQIEYEVFVHDSEGNRLKDQDPINKFYYINDKGETGTVEIDPVTFEKKMETYQKVKDESLNLTIWNNTITPAGATIGQATIGHAVAFLTALENITA